jgi:hypothetical protein
MMAYTQALGWWAVFQIKRRVQLRCQLLGFMHMYKLPTPGFQPLPAPPVVEIFFISLKSACLARLDFIAETREPTA